MAAPLTFGTINVCGLKDSKKRAAVFAWLRSLRLDIIFLQETHCHLKKEEKVWSREWGAPCFWSKGTNKSRGVSILFGKNKAFDVENVVTDTNGRYLRCNLTINCMNYKIINIYAPNDAYERVRFINGINEWMDTDDEIIIGGDFNCTLNTLKDRNNCTGSRDLGQIDIYNLMSQHYLEDIWRRRYPDKSQYSWNRGDKSSRIDYWLVSKSLDNQIDSIDYIPCVFSDHSLVTFKLRISTIKKGPGYWKMNSTLIDSDLFKKAFKSMWEDWQSHMDKYENLNTWWDIGKAKIRELATWCSIKLKQDKTKLINELEYSLSHNDKNKNTNSIESNRRKLKQLYEEIGNGLQVRSRVQWFQEGEKPTRYFHSIEKCKGKDKVWEKIIDDSGATVTNTDDILRVQVDYFKKLYTSQAGNIESELQDEFCDVLDTKLSNENQNILNRDLTKDELYKALCITKSNKSPGPDGLIVEFYKAFWDDLKDPLLKVYNHSFEFGQLPYTQYLAVIVLLYKKGIRELLKNWRPISLINVDAKLLSKVFATRVKIVLPQIIHTDQKGCIQGRLIGQNIRLIEDIVHEMDDDKIILLLDQEKAFDRVEWCWLLKVLRKFSFGENFIRWIQIMYKNMKSSVLTNGYLSEYFSISRGIRQGDALSALLYVIQAEPLAQYLRKCDNVKGIIIEDQIDNNKHEIKGCQYVDDACTILHNTAEIDKCFEIIDNFGRASGSRLNKTKTSGISNKPEPWQYNDINFSCGPEILLGVPVGKGRDADQFWSNKIEKMTKKLKFWSLHDLSMSGKIYIIKSIALSLVLYYMEMIVIDQKHLDRIRRIFWDFLWNGKQVSISTNICELPKSMGGLNLPNIEVIVKVRRIKMLIDILKQKDTWNIIARWMILMVNDLFFVYV